MHKLALASVFALAVSTGTFLVATRVSADPPLRGAPVAGGIAEIKLKPAAAPVAVAKKLELLNKTLKLVNQDVISQLPTAQIKVTPSAPVHSSGAKITFASPATFMGPGNSAPEGSMVLSPASGATGVFSIEFPTDVGKLYIVDCKVSGVWGANLVTVNVVRGDSTQSVTEESGHIMLPFKSDKATQSVKLVASSATAIAGCEITKAN